MTIADSLAKLESFRTPEENARIGKAYRDAAAILLKEGSDEELPSIPPAAYVMVKNFFERGTGCDAQS
jgi:hypothetical protein